MLLGGDGGGEDEEAGPLLRTLRSPIALTSTSGHLPQQQKVQQNTTQQINEHQKIPIQNKNQNFKSLDRKNSKSDN